MGQNTVSKLPDREVCPLSGAAELVSGLAALWLLGLAVAMVLGRSRVYVQRTQRLLTTPIRWPVSWLRLVLRWGGRRTGGLAGAVLRWFMRLVARW